MARVKRLQCSERWLKQKDKNWLQILEATAKAHADTEAVVFKKRRLSYKELLSSVIDVAKGLRAIGVRRGDHVAIWMTNRPEWLVARFAIYRLGAVMIPLNTRYRQDDLNYVLHHSDARVLIMEERFLGKIDAMGIMRSLCPELETAKPGELISERFPLLRSVICLGDEEQGGCLSWDFLLEAGAGISESEVRVESKPEDIAHIMYTSGTTGFPKGVETPYSINISMTTLFGEAVLMEYGDRVLIATPIFGNIGLGLSSAANIVGATTVLTDRFDTGGTLQIIQEERISQSLLVPTILIDMLSHPNFANYDMSSLKCVAVGGAYVPTELIIEAKRKLGAELINAYGLVEASGVSTMVPVGDTPEHITKTVGLALPDCEVAILDPATGEELPAGKEGEICTAETCRGSQHMRGYYKQPELTAKTIVDGWLHSGDLGLIDEDGYLRVTGRLKEMLTVGGFNVSPPEIEEFLLKHPKIQNVAVVGVPDKRLGEVPAAFVQLKPGEKASPEEIVEFCHAGIANIKMPRYVSFVEDFPLNPQGKIQKFKLKERAIQEFGLQERR